MKAKTFEDYCLRLLFYHRLRIWGDEQNEKVKIGR
jgi:hypothetical protein